MRKAFLLYVATMIGSEILLLGVIFMSWPTSHLTWAMILTAVSFTIPMTVLLLGQTLRNRLDWWNRFSILTHLLVLQTVTIGSVGIGLWAIERLDFAASLPFVLFTAWGIWLSIVMAFPPNAGQAGKHVIS